MNTTTTEVLRAAQTLAHLGLVDAFGHVSRRSEHGVLITPAAPLGTLNADTELIEISLDTSELPERAPKEAWLHLSIYRAREDIAGICRAQPPAPAVASAAGLQIVPLHGQGAFLGATVPVYESPRLVRTREQGEALAAALGAAPAVIMRGNGAVSTGRTPGRAAALMAVLERSAQINVAVANTGREPQPLDPADANAWEQVSEELLERLWAHLGGEE